jgi:hypothetical protein
VGLESFTALVYVNEKRVIVKPGGENYTYYASALSTFGKSATYKWLDLTQSMFRDLFLAAVLILVNTLILVQIKNATKNRITLSAGEGGAVSQGVKDSLRAEKRKAIMISLTGVNYILGHSSYLILAIMFRLLPTVVAVDLNGWSCYSVAAFAIYYASYATPFFFYFFFNKHFKKFMTRNLMFVVSPVAGLCGVKIQSEEGEHTQTQTESRRTTRKSTIHPTA